MRPTRVDMAKQRIKGRRKSSHRITDYPEGSLLAVLVHSRQLISRQSWRMLSAAADHRPDVRSNCATCFVRPCLSRPKLLDAIADLASGLSRNRSRRIAERGNVQGRASTLGSWSSTFAWFGRNRPPSQKTSARHPWRRPPEGPGP